MAKKEYEEMSPIFLKKKHADPLRDLAASLGYLITRGPGTGEIGNSKALLEKLSEAYVQSPERVKLVIEQITTSKE